MKAIKAVVVGDAGVGKTSLCCRIAHRTFDPDEVCVHSFLFEITKKYV